MLTYSHLVYWPPTSLCLLHHFSHYMCHFPLHLWQPQMFWKLSYLSNREIRRLLGWFRPLLLLVYTTSKPRNMKIVFITFLKSYWTQYTEHSTIYGTFHKRVAEFIRKQKIYDINDISGWPAIFEMKIQKQFKNIPRTYQYFSRTQATLKIL